MAMSKRTLLVTGTAAGLSAGVVAQTQATGTGSWSIEVDVADETQ